MNFIKKIFEKKIDENVHFQFQKFSRGEFKNKAIIKAKQSKGIFTINTSYEFANEFARLISEKLSERKAKVTGAIISTEDLSEKLKFKEKKQFQGVKRYIIDTEMSGNEITWLLNEFPKAFFALSFEANGTSIKIKPKSPKSGKPGAIGEKTPKPDFCKLITNDKEIGTGFVFEKPDFKEAEFSHDFIIKEIIVPKGETDFAKIREMAKRKSKIIRKGSIDGKEIKSEIEFEA